MDSIHFLIKPASGRCNMRCRYCFYEDEKINRQQADLGMMSLDTAELLIRRAMAEGRHHVSFAFQGGEPMLAGLPFYRAFVSLVDKHRPSGLSVSYSIQTNGTLVTAEWADFFRQSNFLVGLSLDGTRDLHDLYRLYADGKKSYSDVLAAFRLLSSRKVEANLLCVVTAQTAKKGQSVYQQMKKTGCRYLQFIPCLDPINMPRGTLSYSLSPELYARFLKTIFDLWYRDWESGNYVSIRLFDDYVHLLCGRPTGTCATCGSCGQYFTVEADGSVYPCDFFVLDPWRLGSLKDMSLTDLAQCERAKSFVHQGRGHPPACEGCRWLSLCNGGCRRDWVDRDSRNFFCSSMKDFFAYAAPRLMTIARAERMLF